MLREKNTFWFTPLFKDCTGGYYIHKDMSATVLCDDGYYVKGRLSEEKKEDIWLSRMTNALIHKMV